ncbi:MAG TPA: hypothetical protein VFU05_11535 [Cyclobacteriaceae bacterium]|nr:hypothetical protein [Cyclobacteriaceae bacterium]
MKSFFLILIAALTLTSFTKSKTAEEVELVCTKRHSTSNTCHYNFKINGTNYRYVDINCKGKKDEIIKDAQEGKLGLAKEWKIPCPEPKEKAAN